MVYFQHLHKCGFRARDTVYQVFASNVFHDGAVGEITLDVENRSLRLALKNVWALDRVCWALPKKRPVRVQDADFRTTVTLHGVSQARWLGLFDLSQPEYFAACLSGRPGAYIVDIAFHGVMWNDFCWLNVHFRSMAMNDIEPNLKKYKRYMDAAARQKISALPRYADPGVEAEHNRRMLKRWKR
jgi:hypothetical protein